MTCEDEPIRLTWEIELYEPFSQVWINKGWGRATTRADPAGVARAVLAGYLAGKLVRGETFRAKARPDGGTEVTVTADQLPGDGWEPGPTVREALPAYLRDALPGAG